MLIARANYSLEEHEWINYRYTNIFITPDVLPKILVTKMNTAEDQ